MKKTQSKSLVPSVPYSGILFGTEHDGSLLSGNCAPSVMADFTSGGFEVIQDEYYNPWPSPRREAHGWKMTRRGIHVTQDIEDIKTMLGQENCEASITSRCVDRLVELGFSVSLKRTRTVVTTHKTVVGISRSNNGLSERIVSDTTQTHVHVSGRWDHKIVS